MNLFYLLATLSLWLLLPSSLPAQPHRSTAAAPPARTPPPPRIRFEHLTVADGLPENSVRCLIQDHLGFMWLGTQNGLVRYDGSQMTVFRYDPKSPFSLKGRQIRALLEDRNGDIWVGCESLFRFERATGRFIEYPRQGPERTAPNDRTDFIHEDRKGNLWTITNRNNFTAQVLDRLDSRTRTWTYFRHNPKDPHTLAANNIYTARANVSVTAVEEDPNGNLWVVTQGETENTLHRFDFGRNRFERVRPKLSAEGANRFRKIGFTTSINGQLYLSSLEQGLFRLDPKTGQMAHFRHDPANPASLACDTITQVYQARDGQIWVPHTQGVDRFDPRTGRFTHFLAKSNDPTTPSPGLLRLLHEMPNGDIWFVTFNGLNLYHRQSGRFVRYEFDPAAGDGTLHGFGLFSFLVDRTGLVWAGSFRGGLNKQSRIARFPLLTNDPKNSNSLQSSNVTVVYEAPSEPGVIWFGSDKGLDRLDKKTGQYTHYRHDSLSRFSLGQGLITAIAEDKKGRFWVGTGANGLYQMNRKTGRFTRLLPDPKKNPNESQLQYINTLLPVKDGTLWVSGLGELVHLNPDRQTYVYYNESDSTYAPALFAQLAGLAVPPRQLAAILHPQGAVDKIVPFSVAKPTDVCVVSGGSLQPPNTRWDYGWLEDANGRVVWSMTPENSKSDGVSNRRMQVQTLRLPAGSYRLRYKSDPVYYYGSWPFGPPSHPEYQGIQLLIITPAESRQLAALIRQPYFRPGLSDETIFTLREDRAGHIWNGSNNGGVFRMNPRTGQFNTYQNLFSGPNCVISLLEDPQAGGFWVGDYLHGLLFLDQNGNITRQYAAGSGLSANSVRGIARDEGGNLWVTTNKGLVRFHPKTEQFRVFSGANGVQDFEHSPSENVFRASDGELYVAGEKGVHAFYPKQFQADAFAPPVVLTDLAINGQPATLGEDGQLPAHVSVAKEITLSHDQNDLTFHFAALAYNQGKECRYAYRLMPNDTGWVQAGRQQQARFLDLRPGEYTFRVKAANADGGWYEKGVSVKVTIRPPWWQTWWAYLLYVLAFGALLRAYIVYRSRALRRENQVLEAKVAQRTNQVQEQKEEILAQRDHLEQTLTELKTTQTQLIQKEKLASLGELTAGIAHEIQNPLNFVTNFSEVSTELVGELVGELDKGDPDEAKVIAGDLSQNLQKITLHGQRASAIVRGMLEHSRASTGEKVPTDLNALADEYLRLAYHGLRARDKDFNAELKTDFDPNLRTVNVVPQEMGRVLLNLFNNAFFAVSEKQKMAPPTYQPTVIVSTQRTDDSVDIQVSDNGTGMPEAVKAKIFQPFFTTKPTGQGTGLGLSLSYDIVTKGHGGTMAVKSSVGDGTQLRITLPR